MRTRRGLEGVFLLAWGALAATGGAAAAAELTVADKAALDKLLYDAFKDMHNRAADLYNAGVVFFLRRGAPVLPPPGTPTQVTVTVGPGDGTATVAWQPPAGGSAATLTRYLISATAVGGVADPLTRQVPASATSVVLRGLRDLTPYTVTVTAANAVATGPPSSPPVASCLLSGLSGTAKTLPF